MTTETPFAYSFALFDDAHDSKHASPWKVPLKIATDKNFAEYGRLVRDFDKEEVWIKEWPLNGWRKMHPGTGKQGGIAHGVFRYKWKDDGILHAVNEACPEDGPAAICRLPKDVTAKNKTHALVRELNYHPDGGQVFYPRDGQPYVALLALPGDDVKLENFVAFYVDGNLGLQIKSDIWHQAMIPLVDEAVFLGKQGKVHGCVMFDSVKEYDKYLLVPLKPEFAE